MSLICTYPVDGSTAVHRLIKGSIWAATDSQHVQCASTFSGVWVTTVTGLEDVEEVHFTMLVSEHCKVKKV
jgi:hypothetical protein